MLIADKKREEYSNSLIRYKEEAYDKDISMPKRFCFVLTNLCNLACDYCFQIRTKQKNAMNKDQWIDLLKQIPKGSRITLTGGEPLVFKGFDEVFKEAVKNHECNIVCNGIMLNEEYIELFLSSENFKVLSISIENRNNQIRKLANVNEKKWDEKWAHTEKMMRHFAKRKKELNHPATLDSKTVVLDENAHELFDTHIYCIEELFCDTHSYQFLKGSPIYCCDYMYKFDDIFIKSSAYKYNNWELIKEQLQEVKNYNYKNNKLGFLHPKISDLNIDDSQLDKKIDILNEIDHIKENFKPCKSPWASAHVNVDGTVFPCLAISMGNVQENSLKEILEGEEYKKFRKVIRDYHTVEACNRCGWL